MLKKIMVLASLFMLTQLAFAILRDPTCPPGMEMLYKHVPFQVKSVIHSKNRKFALIGDHYYRVGHTIMSYKIVDIKNQTVYFENKGQAFSVSVVDSIKKSHIGKAINQKGVSR